MKGKRPDYTVSTVVQTENGDHWRKIGVAFSSDKEDLRLADAGSGSCL